MTFHYSHNLKVPQTKKKSFHKVPEIMQGAIQELNNILKEQYQKCLNKRGRGHSYRVKKQIDPQHEYT
jgi:hypothetical protein